jgi:hypothetical protein
MAGEVLRARVLDPYHDHQQRVTCQGENVYYGVDTSEAHYTVSSVESKKPVKVVLTRLGDDSDDPQSSSSSGSLLRFLDERSISPSLLYALLGSCGEIVSSRSARE